MKWNRIGRFNGLNPIASSGRSKPASRMLATAVLATVGAAAWCGDASAATFTYSPANNSTDSWSAGTNWTASAPASATISRLTFVADNVTPLADNLTNTNVDDISGNFALNILDLQGAGPADAGAPATININSAAPSTGLQFISNGSTTPTINLNSNTGASTLTYNVSTPITFSNNTTVGGNGTGVFNFTGNLTGGATTLAKNGTSILTLSGSSTFTGGTVQAAGGVLNISGGSITATNFQNTGTGAILNQTGGTITSLADSRLSLSNSQWNISGGVFNLNKMVVGANAGTTGDVLVVSGNAVVNQNQTTTNNHELWIGGNNGGQGSLLLKDSATWNGGARLNNTTYYCVVGNFNGSTAAGTLTVQDNAVFNWTGTVGNNSALIRVADFAVANGTVNLNGGTIAAIGFSKGAGTGTINANGGTFKAMANINDYFLGFTGTGGTNSVNILGGGLKFDSNSFNAIVTNPLSGNGGLTKLGAAGLLTLSGSSSYSGPTNVNAGTLSVTGSIASPTTVSNGGTLSLAGTINGNLTVGAGAALLATGTVTGASTFSGATTFLTPANGTPFNSNTIDASGSVLTIKPTATLPGSPTVIMNAPGGITGGIGTNFLLAARATLSLQGGTQLLLSASGSNVITWTGTNSTTWNVQTTQNWTNLGSADVFFNLDNVTFDDNAATFTVAVQGTGVQPNSVTFANNAHDYTITGGAIGGPASVSFNGSHAVTLTNNNTYTGGTTINSGTVQLGDGTNPGGSLGTGSVTNNGVISINYGANNGAVANAISGSGSVNVAGTATITFSGSNTFGGGASIGAGASAAIATGSSLGTGSVSNAGAIYATGTTTLPNIITGAGSLNANAGTTTLTGNSGYSGNTTIAAGATLSLGNGGTTGSITSAIANSGTLVYNRSDNITINNTISGTGAIVKEGTGIATLATASVIHALEVGVNQNGGTLTFAQGSTVSLGDGTGFLNIGKSTTASNGTAVLDASGVASFTANFDQIDVGTAANANGFSSGKLMLPANSSLTGATQIIIGDSTGARNQQDDTTGSNIQLTTGAGGTTTVRTPAFSVGRSKTSASLALGAGNTFDLAGTGGTPRTLMGVGNMQTGGGGGNFYQTADFSAGVFKGFLSNLLIANQNDNAGVTGVNLTSTMTIGTDAANHLDVSGTPFGLTAQNSGVVTVAQTIEAAATGLAQGTLTIGNLDTTSAITVTDGAGGIGSGNGILVGGANVNGSGAIYSIGTLNLNGGTLTITTSGAAISGPGLGTAGIAFVNFNGTTLKAGASSANWINNIVINGGGGGASGAFVMDGGVKIDTNGFAVTVPQTFVAAGAGGLTKYGLGTLTLTGNNAYSGASVITGGALVVNNAAQPVILNNGGGDVQQGRLIFDYSGGGADPIGQVLPILQAGFNEAIPFSSGQIRSSTATSAKGLGYLDDGTGQRLTVAYTYFGDANLDGTVNALDFNALATNFGSAAPWSAGDFNYDGMVGTSDFVLLAGNFNQALPLPAPLLGALVPEPASLGMLALMLGLVARRRSTVMRGCGPSRE